MKRFITQLAPIKALALRVAVAISVVVSPMTAYATPTGTAFYIGAENPEELAQVIETSLREDETGNTRVRPRDPGDRAYATPRQFLVMLQQSDPRANLVRVDQLPAYLRSLRDVIAPEGRYWSACVTPTGARLRCELRSFHEGERAWVNPQTAETVFMQGCTNPIDGNERPDCYVFTFNYREERSVRMVEGRAAVTTHFTRLTEENFARMYADECYFVEDADGRRKPDDDCPTLYCPPGSAWPQVALAQAVGLPGTPPEISISFQLRNGQGILSVPSWVVDDLGNVIPCVVTVPYPVAVPEYRGWRAVARFDVAVRETIIRTEASGRYPQPFIGAVHY